MRTKPRVVRVVSLLATVIAILALAPNDARARCTEVSCAATYGGAELTGVTEVHFNGDGVVTSWECHYSDGTVITSTCTPAPE